MSHSYFELNNEQSVLTPLLFSPQKNSERCFMITGSGAIGQCYSDGEWLPGAQRCAKEVKQYHIHPCKSSESQSAVLNKRQKQRFSFIAHIWMSYIKGGCYSVNKLRTQSFYFPFLMISFTWSVNT